MSDAAARTDQDRAKQAAADAALKEFVRDGMVLGLGSGSTSLRFVRALGAAVAQGLEVTAVPSSTTTRELAFELGVPLATFAEVQHLDLTIDGADEVDPDGNMLKGGGGSLLWERIVAGASDRMVAMVDPSKTVERLGAFPLAIEVVRFGWESTRASLERTLAALGHPEPKLVLRTNTDGSPFTTDSGNHILDAHLGAIDNPLELDARINWVPGAVEHGLFTGVAKAVVLGRPDGSHEVRDTAANPAARALR
ncbi:ribose 5-phosphate isomerase A [Mangrovactinospora gilvigrisea]|uniref:Ribose-5-phosphate isomerase A n=1 Tax=Mangrovactinospora gilvigrisea TaxID=1428644 RepID=A0A1J7C1J7_9ACTN|nr:ribose-5-phosphate isomerase RpiA [Mangrovactinospora gilvigrisea]OIV35452.1 ribose 5-phosphate isomerase A [Mangrovactinospora gilvigrisea]